MADNPEYDFSKTNQVSDSPILATVEGSSVASLNLGLWYVQHKKNFFIALVGLLLLVIVVGWGTSGAYFFLGLGSQVGNFGGLFTPSNNPRDHVAYSVVKVLANSDGSYDLLGTFANNNRDQVARFNYRFMINGTVIGQASAFVYPGQTKFLPLFGQTIKGDINTVTMQIINPSWSKVPANISNWSDFYNQHTSFLIQNNSYTAPPDANSLGQVSFSLTNQTAYNYYQPQFLIILYDLSGIPVGFNYYTIGQLLSDEAKQVNLGWPGNLPGIGKIDILPNIDILDSNSYIQTPNLPSN